MVDALLSIDSFLIEASGIPRQSLKTTRTRDSVILSSMLMRMYRTTVRALDERGLKPYDIESRGDLEKLPTLDKRTIRNRFADLLSDEYDLTKVARGNTSGTTGSPLEICYDPEMIRMNYAMLDRQYRWVDTDLGRFGDRVAVIRGNVIVPLSQAKPPFWRYNHLHRQMLLSSFHLSRDNLGAYIAELRRFSPRVLDGYPSTLYILAKYLKNGSQKLPLHAVLSSSETLYEFPKGNNRRKFRLSGVRLFRGG